MFIYSQIFLYGHQINVFPACRKDYHAIFHLVLMLEGGYYAHYIMKVFVCNCYSYANENLSKLHFQCCLFLKIFLRQQEHHIIINDNPQIARDGIIISFIVVKVFTLMKRVQVLISAKDKSIQLTVLCFLQKKVHMLASAPEQYMIAKSFEHPMTMDENIIILNVQLARTILFIDLLFYLK